MPNLRSKTWTTTTPANVEDAQYWEDHLISDTAAAKAASSVQTVNSTSPDANGNVDVVALPSGGTLGQVLTKQSSADGDADWEDPASSGHTIEDEDGNTMPYQSTLQFVNAEVTNDAVNSKTVVDCKGAKGDAATVTAGTTTTLPAGSSATVVNAGTTSAAVFNFGIPQGADGADGTDGVSVTGVTLLSTSGKVKTYRMSFSNGSHFDYNVTDGSDGTGAGDMLKTDYDSTSVVYNAGGIAAYVSGVLPVITNTYSSTSEDGMSGKAVASAISGISIPVITNTYSSTSEDGMSGKAVASAISGKADSSSLATVAISGLYSDLSGKPTIPAAQVNSDWSSSSGVSQILNKPTIPVVTNTYSSSSNDGMSGVAVASAISGKADSSDLDTYLTSVTQLNGKATFDNLDPSYGYDLYYDDQGATGSVTVPTWAGTYTKTNGTDPGTIKLAYDINGGVNGTSKWTLRVLK